MKIPPRYSAAVLGSTRNRPTPLEELDSLGHGYRYTAATQLPHSVPGVLYYDASADARARDEFYAGIDNLDQLRVRLTQTHRPHPGGYEAVCKESLYGFVDRHPDGVLRSIYTQKPVRPISYPDLSFRELDQMATLTLAVKAATAPEVLGAWLAFKRGMPAFNCEHAVPQNCFARREPMRSDLHHLFACDPDSNARRGDDLYNRFTPPANQGKLARATLYFLLRYPDVKLNYSRQDIENLKRWALQDPPDEHERHRNREIQLLQGNRNPFIDDPEWVKKF